MWLRQLLKQLEEVQDDKRRNIDVSKGKSSFYEFKPYEEIVCRPFKRLHVEKNLDTLENLMDKLMGKLGL